MQPKSTGTSKSGDDIQSKSLSAGDPLEKKTIKELKQMLKLKGLPVTARRKAELIERLNNGYIGPKPKAWQHSDAKKDLKRALLNPTSSIHKMSIEEVLNSDTRFKEYPNFAKYYRDLQELVTAEKQQVKQDDAAAEEYVRKYARSRFNERGYPYWDTHSAKPLLEVDVANNMHEKMKPEQLQKTRGAYMEFPKSVFATRVYNEIAKQKGAQFWAYKRNKRGMKKYLKDLAILMIK